MGAGHLRSFVIAQVGVTVLRAHPPLRAPCELYTVHFAKNKADQMVQEISGEDEFRRLTGSKGKLVVVRRCSAVIFLVHRRLSAVQEQPTFIYFCRDLWIIWRQRLDAVWSAPLCYLIWLAAKCCLRV